jgi:PTH2 family peptidyl-tRNA hydrolase
MSHKQVIVMRKDLGMRKGKMVAQGAHASMAAIFKVAYTDAEETQMIIDTTDVRIRNWLLGNFKKVCVYVNSEEELLALYQKAKDLGIITALITDAGLTEFNGVPTNTCIAVGPDFENKIDMVTGGLPLL